MKPVIRDAMNILHHKPADTVPFIIWGPAPFVAYAAGVSQKNFYLDAKFKMETQLKVVELFPDAWLMPGVWPDFGAVLEPSMFGSKICWRDNEPPSAIPVIRSCTDISKVRFNWKSSLLPEMLKQYEYMWKYLPSHYIDDYGFLDGVAYALGPAETAGLVLDTTEFLYGTYDEPELLHKLLDMITEGILFSINEQEKINGKIKKIYLADHMAHQMSREAFLEFCYPYYKQICDEYPGCEFILYHNEGSQLHIKEKIGEFGATITHYGDDTCALAEGMNENVIFMGNLHPLDLMLKESPQEVYQAATRLLENAPRGRIWLSTAGGMAPGTPLENVQAAIQAGKDFGRRKII